MSLITQFTNGRLLRDHQLISEDLWMSDGKIVGPQEHADTTVDLNGKIVAPGFIDLQVNGGFGVDLVNNPEGLQVVARKIPRFGVTSFVAAVITSDPEQYRHVLPLLQPRDGGDSGANVLGIHLEGPFLCPEKRGMHPSQHLKEIGNDAKEAISSVYGSLDGVRIVTLAPELPGAVEVIRFLREKEILVSIGHTMATHKQSTDAVDAGATLVTHLFSAMAPFHQREPGTVGAALADRRVLCCTLVDGQHLHDATVDLIWSARKGDVILVTDAMAAMGLGPGQYRFGGVDVTVEGSKATVTGTDTLAGVVDSMDGAVRRLKKITGCSAVQALEAASLVPAKALGIEQQKGSLHSGADADLIILDDDLYVKNTYVNGRLVGAVEPAGTD